MAIRRHLTVVPCPTDPTLIAIYGNRYHGIGTHTLLCGNCSYDVAVGVDPYLFPVMFETARVIRCCKCGLYNQIPPSL
jgi:hypothetical protein